MANRVSGKFKPTARHKRLRWDREAETDTDYAHATGRIRLLEERFLSFADFETLVAYTTSDSERGQILDQAGYPAAVHLEGRVLAGRAANNQLLAELDRGGVLTRALLLDLDYHNLKLLMKYYLQSNESVDETASNAANEQTRQNDLPPALKQLLIPEAYTDVDLLRREILEALSLDKQELADAMKEENITSEQLAPEAIDPWLRLAVYRLILAWQAHPEAVTVDIEADKLYFEHAAGITQDRLAGSARGFLRDYFSLRADIANLQMLLRIRRFQGGKQYLRRVLVSGGEVPEESFLLYYDASAEDLARMWRDQAGLAVELADYIVGYQNEDGIWALGEAADNLLVRLAEHSRRQSFSADTVAGFWLSRQIEGQNLRILLSGLERGYSGQDLLHLLRHVYRRETR